MSAKPHDFTLYSELNDHQRKLEVEVANCARFTCLEMSAKEKLQACSVLYMHVNKVNRKCYIGITIMQARFRWGSGGVAYRNNRRFGAAIARYGWQSFETHILAFVDGRDALNEVEVMAISAAGGHKSRYTYNLSPGGDFIAETSKAIVGVHLETGVARSFKSGSEAARILGISNPDMPMAVARRTKNRSSVKATDGHWWFRFADDELSQPPKAWGESFRVARVTELLGRRVVAIHRKTLEQHLFSSTGEAAKVLGLTQPQVFQVVSGKIKSSRNWWFRYEDEDREMPSLYGAAATRAKLDRAVYAIHLKTKQVIRFRNCTDADAALKLYPGAASTTASGTRASAGEWWFSYDPHASPPSEFKGALVAKARSIPVVATRVDDGSEALYPSAKAASIALGMSRAAICKSISGELGNVKGFSFRKAR